MSTTLNSIKRANHFLSERGGPRTGILVVDNSSTDRTVDVTKALGVQSIHEPIRSIARARNTGAKAARGDIFIFVDADVIIPENLLWRVFQVMLDPAYIGGTVDTNYQPVSISVKIYLQMWRVVGKLLRMVQGAIQFIRRDAFFYLGGYDETLFMGEDVDLYWRLRRKTIQEGLQVSLIDDIRVTPSCRRFDQLPLWRILIYTNPIMVALFRHRKEFWNDWYENPLR